MTCIVYRAGVLASDTADWAGNVICGFRDDKIVRTKAGWLVGASGFVSDCVAFIRWVEDGMSEPKPDLSPKRFTGLTISPEGEVTTWGGKLAQTPEPYPYVVIGAAEEFCRGALAHGATAAEAVQLAIDNLNCAGGKVVTLELEPPDEFAPGFEMPDEQIETPERELTWREKRGLA